MNLQIPQGSKVLELGGGANPMLPPRCLGGDCVNMDVRDAMLPDGRRTVDIVASLEEPFPITTGEFDFVVSRFCIEHVSFTKTKQFVSECFRVLKPGGRAIIIAPNTAAQTRWIDEHQDGWDGKCFFNAASEKLFGSQDYPDNTHKSYWSPDVAFSLFGLAGFGDVITSPYGERSTDLLIEAVKPIQASTKNPTEPLDRAGEAAAVDRAKGAILPQAATSNPAPPLPRLTEFESVTGRSTLFDKKYFDSGKFGGGFAGGGYRDFPCHEVTARHVLARQPKSVLELGASRGYVLKRIQDARVPAWGIDISRHCHLTRVCDGIFNSDVCETPWQIGPAGSDGGVDLCFSISFWEHVPEELVPRVAEEMRRVCKRGLHGIDLSENPSCKDRTKCTLKSRKWWVEQLGAGHEVLPKDELERGQLPESVLKGDGKVKWNLCSFSTQYHHGWVNCDIYDQSKFAEAEKYVFRRLDVREGIPLLTGVADYFFMHHALEHFSFDEGLTLLRELRRCIKPDGGLRIVVPNARELQACYNLGTLGQFDESNEGSAKCPTQGGKFWHLLGEGHRCCFDQETLCGLLTEAGWEPAVTSFRNSKFPQILKETTEMDYGGYSLFVDASPRLG